MIPRDLLRNTRTARRLTDEQKELRSLRAKAGLAQSEMAMRLGVKLATLQSYEYGRTQRVPLEVMVRARCVVGDPNYHAAKALYQDTSITEIASAWMSRLQIKRGRYSDLAAVLSVDRATVSRWFDADPKVHQEPSVSRLAEYERAVRAAEYILLRQQPGLGRRSQNSQR